MNSSLRFALSLVLCLASTDLTPSAARITSLFGRSGYVPARSVLGTTMLPKTISSHQLHLKSSGHVLLPIPSQPTLLQFPASEKNSLFADDFLTDTKARLLDLLTAEFMTEIMLEESHKASDLLISGDTQQTMTYKQPHKEEKRTLAEKLKSKKEELKQKARKRAQEYLENYLKEIREKPLEAWKKAERMKKEKQEAKARLKEQIAQLLLKRGGFAGLYLVLVSLQKRHLLLSHKRHRRQLDQT